MGNDFLDGIAVGILAVIIYFLAFSIYESSKTEYTIMHTTIGQTKDMYDIGYTCKVKYRSSAFGHDKNEQEIKTIIDFTFNEFSSKIDMNIILFSRVKIFNSIANSLKLLDNDIVLVLMKNNIIIERQRGQTEEEFKKTYLSF